LIPSLFRHRHLLQPRFGSGVADFATQKALRSIAALVAEIERRALFLRRPACAI
jgi:hypothetical protein